MHPLSAETDTSSHLPPLRKLPPGLQSLQMILMPLLLEQPIICRLPWVPCPSHPSPCFCCWVPYSCLPFLSLSPNISNIKNLQVSWKTRGTQACAGFKPAVVGGTSTFFKPL